MVMMFPNLQDLYWEWDYGHGGTHKIEELRDQSEALREAGQTWTQLRSIKADIDSIHVLALRQELDLLAILTELDKRHIRRRNRACSSRPSAPRGETTWQFEQFVHAWGQYRCNMKFTSVWSQVSTVWNEVACK